MTTLDTSVYPDEQLHLVDTQANPATCWWWQKSDGETARDDLGGVRADHPGACRPGGQGRADGQGRQVRRAGRPGVLRPRLRQLRRSARATIRPPRPQEALWWVSESGVRFGVDRDQETLRALGLGTPPKPAPWAVLRLFADGPDAVEGRRAGAPRHLAGRCQRRRIGAAEVKLGFVRAAPGAPPAEIKPEPVALPTPLKVPPPEGKPWWIVIVAIGVIGLVVGMVWSRLPAVRAPSTAGMRLFPILMVVGVVAMLFGGPVRRRRPADVARQDGLRCGPASCWCSTSCATRWTAPPIDMDANYRWYHPPVRRWKPALGGPRMWERSPAGKDKWFGVARVGVGMTSLTEARSGEVR